MERLTSSPYVMNIYGHCGQSALTEPAFSEKGMNNLYRLSMGLRGIDTPYVLRTKVQIAAMVALGLSHVHTVALDNDHDNGKEVVPTTATSAVVTTIAHYDINPRNVIMTQSGKPKINDFNVAEFLRWNSKTREPCGFESRMHEPWW